MKELLQKKNRNCAGPTAPAKGLYLLFVQYPFHFDFPKPRYDSIF